MKSNTELYEKSTHVNYFLAWLGRVSELVGVACIQLPGQRGRPLWTTIHVIHATGTVTRVYSERMSQHTYSGCYK